MIIKVTQASCKMSPHRSVWAEGFPSASTPDRHSWVGDTPVEATSLPVPSCHLWGFIGHPGRCETDLGPQGPSRSQEEPRTSADGTWPMQLWEGWAAGVSFVTSCRILRNWFK